MMMSAEMAYSAKDYEKALTVYKQLKDKAVFAGTPAVGKDRCTS